MSFDAYAHGPVCYWNNPRVISKGAAVVVEFENKDRVWGWVLQEGNFGQIDMTTDAFPILRDLPLASVQDEYECFTVNWWQYEVLPTSRWVPTRPRSSRVLAQVAARRDADRRANE